MFREKVYKRYNSLDNISIDTDIQTLLLGRKEYIKQFIQRHFPNNKDANIIDLGCGAGAIIYVAQELGYTNISGVDVSSEQVLIAKKNYIQVQEGNIFDAIKNNENASLDCVLTFDLIEHLTKDELLELGDSIFKALKPGGVWLIHAPNALSPFVGEMRYGDLTHELAFTSRSLAQVVHSVGFNSLSCYEDIFVLNTFRHYLRYVLWKSWRFILKIALAAETGRIEHIFTQNLIAKAIK